MACSSLVLHGFGNMGGRIAENSNLRVSQYQSQLAISHSAKITVLNASSERDIDTAFATLVQQHVGALLVASSPLFTGGREQLVALATRHAIPQFLNGQSSVRWVVR
jgi:hypothetical protein